jgi:16S rRNA (guanine1516-N2)-methyltransferase
LEFLIQWIHSNEPRSLQQVKQWQEFLNSNPIKQGIIQKIDLSGSAPVLIDSEGRKLSIDFLSNLQNYSKKKGTIKTELISRAMGAGRSGTSILDLSAGLGIDAIFLSQLGYEVTALERNPLLYLALNTAQQELPADQKEKIKFEFASAKSFLENCEKVFDVIYFDPMFPEKKKSALPRQEMVIFRNLIGSDDDANSVIQTAINLKKAKRIVVKRPIKAPLLFEKPQGQIEGKLIRFDIYGVHP